MNQTTKRVPLADSYITTNLNSTGFHARPVVGGLFIKLLTDRAEWQKWSSRDHTKLGGWAPLPAKNRLRQKAAIDAQIGAGDETAGARAGQENRRPDQFLRLPKPPHRRVRQDAFGARVGEPSSLKSSRRFCSAGKKPGVMVLTRTLRGAHSRARNCDRFNTAALEAE
jgi:hypothetical protein